MRAGRKYWRYTFDATDSGLILPSRLARPTIGMQQMLLGAAGAAPFAPGFNAASISQGDTWFYFNPDGTGSGGNLTYWGTPTTAGVGSGYWIKHNSPSVDLGMVANTWYQLNVTRGMAVQAEGGSAGGTVSVAASAGGTVLASCSFSIINS